MVDVGRAPRWDAVAPPFRHPFSVVRARCAEWEGACAGFAFRGNFRGAALLHLVHVAAGGVQAFP
jgi:hypothetical protein